MENWIFYYLMRIDTIIKMVVGINQNKPHYKFCILMIMGVGAALGGVMVGADVYVDYAIMIIFSLSLLIALKTGIIGRPMGIALTIGYVAYLIVTFFK